MKKLGRLILAIMIVLQMVCAQMIPTFAAEDDDDYVDPNSAVPEIVLVNGPVYDVGAGETKEIHLRIKNSSAFTAKSIMIQPSFPEINDTPFSVSFKGNGNKVNSLAPHSETDVTIIVDMDATATTKNYPITLNYTYFNNYSKKFTGTSTMYLKVKNVTAKPEFALEDIKMTPSSMNPGDASQISGYITNKSVLPMHDVEISLDGLEAEGISVSNGMGSKRITKIGPASSSTFAFPLVAGNEMKGGNYPITFKVTFKDESGKEYEDSQKYYVNVGGTTSKKPELEMKNMTEPQGTYGVNQNFTVSFDLSNTGESEAKNIVVTAKGVGEGEVVPKSTSIKNLKMLKPGQAKKLSFVFAGTSSAKTQNYPIEFTVEYENGGSNVVSFKQYAGVNISNPTAEDGKTSKPKIIISDYKCNPLIVMAGKEFDLNMTFMNTHKNKAVKNIKMFLTLSEETSSDTEKTGNIFTPVNSSNTFYFDDIPAKGKVKKDLRLFVVPDAQPKTYTLTVNFEYEDLQGNEYTATELLGINVEQVTDLEIGEFELPQEVEQGMPVMVSFEYFNKGKVTLDNVMIKIEGDVESSTKSTYVGNLESGYNDYFEGELYANNLGKTPVSIVITYDDPSGETKEVRKDFELNVIEPMMPEDMDMEMPEESMDHSLGKGKIIGIVVAVVVVIAIIGIVIFKKRRKKLEEAFLAEDDDDDTSVDM